ncbi:MAG: hypothetical protein KC668_20365, partial [Myxococcales bacterium]|nr:hypothetical protein [Myxococcales bacterium]
MNTKTRFTAALLPITLALACGETSTSAPDAPAGVAASAQAGHIEVRWADQSDNEEGFVVGRMELSMVDAIPDLATLEELTTVTADQEVFRDDGVVEGRFYAYAIAAENEHGRSEFVLQGGAGVATLSTDPSAGCVVAVITEDDPDGDGLSTALENEGWLVRFDESGQGDVTEVRVMSDPTSGDSDGDGVCDALERQLRTNPVSSDTDGDGLTDADEIRVWGSSPTNVDSDADAEGNSAFFDGAEVERYGTSPTLADTDGDGRSDFVEINQNATNALLADVPRPQIEISSAIQVDLHVELSNGTVNTAAITSSLTESTEATTGYTLETSTSSALDLYTEATVGVSLGTTNGAKYSTTSSVTGTFVDEMGLTFDTASTESSRDAYSQAVASASTRGQTIRGGTLSTTVSIHNGGT